MDILDSIGDWGKQAWSKVQNLFGARRPKRIPLCAELTRFFFTEAIADRVKFLSALADGQEKEVLHANVLEEYTNRVEADIKRVCHSQS
ncbi:MAG TPA: hypothetical protein VKB46_00955, partial [Pyrinomonadaceae bacterium]|nr:hypothetical protein [Pyrinomonadaceae bacterium]